MRADIRSAIRPIAVTAGALVTAIVLWVVAALSMAAALAATALIVPGTGTPDANIIAGYKTNAQNYYIEPFNPACDANCDLVGIDYPAQFWPIPLPGWGGLKGAKWNVSTGKGLTNLNSTLLDTLKADPTDNVTIFGYSQGGNIVTREKSLLKNLDPTTKAQLSFVVIGDTNRPNGGLFERLAFLGTVPILDATFGLPAPTDTGIDTTDIAFEYDGVADFPIYPLNLLATLNAIAGFWYVHGTYLAPNENSDPGELPDDYTPEELADQLDITKNPDNFSHYGDTTYVTIPTRTLPIVRPLLEFGGFTGTTFIIKPIVDLISPALRVLIDSGYDRTLSFGVPAPFRLIPLFNPLPVIADLTKAVGQGVDAFIADVTGKSTAAKTTSTATPLAAAARTTEKIVTTETETESKPDSKTESKPEAKTESKSEAKTESTATDDKTDVGTGKDATSPQTEAGDEEADKADTEKATEDTTTEDTKDTKTEDVKDDSTDSPVTSITTKKTEKTEASEKSEASSSADDGTSAAAA